MAPAVVPASPALRAAVIQCVNQPAASLAVQQAAIQVYRLAPVPEEASQIISMVWQLISIITFTLLILILLISFCPRAERFSCRCFWTAPALCKSVLLHTWYLWRTPNQVNWPSWLMPCPVSRTNNSRALSSPILPTFCPQLSPRLRSEWKESCSFILIYFLIRCFT